MPLGLLRDFLPWRARAYLDRQELESLRRQCDKLIEGTSPYAADGDGSEFEVHSLLGSRHVGMCLWSIKSFLHHAQRPFSIVLHDDGSLSLHDIEKLKRHLPGVRVIRKVDADELIKPIVSSWKAVEAYRFGTLGNTDYSRKMSIFSLKLLDFNLLTAASRILVLDTDVLFFREPSELLDWVDKKSGSQCMYCFEDYVPVRNRTGAIIRFDRKATPSCYFNSGLICFDKSVMDLDALDRWLKEQGHLTNTLYTFEQFAYNALVHQSTSHGPLSTEYSFNFNSPDCVATHFGIKSLFFENIERIRGALVGNS
jgi:lipopolysaccharide biosynthesis glycosyltransferase